MAHRTVDFGAGPVQVFDSDLGARHWAKKHEGDCIVLVRGKYYFQRKDGGELTVRLNATECPENAHLFRAANAVADEVEAMLLEPVD